MLKMERTLASNTMPFLRGEPGSPLWAAVCFTTRGLDELSLSPESRSRLCSSAHWM
jgi:hypothetical protein